MLWQAEEETNRKMPNTVEESADNPTDFVPSVRQRHATTNDERENTSNSLPDILLQDSIQRSLK